MSAFPTNMIQLAEKDVCILQGNFGVRINIVFLNDYCFGK